MRRPTVFLAVSWFLLSQTAVFAQNATVTGRIKAFECGDNCYLILKSESGKTITGLCDAPQCTPWLENQQMPTKFIK